MIDPKQLLEQVLGSGAAGDWRGAAAQARDRLNQAGGAQAFGAGAISGGLLGLLLGSRKVRKLAGGAAGYGGAAVLGAIAYRAWETYRQSAGTPTATMPAQASLAVATPPALLPHAQPAADGSSFELVLVRGMIAAAKADGEVDANEQQHVFAEVERLGLDAEDKALVFDALAKPAEPAAIAGLVASPEQAAELYLASRLAINPDSAAERAYLDALAARLKLPGEVRASLDREALT
ncbi:MAG: tellurite resistance TerB family protein [Steroidobacteraceae bacterium]